MLLNPPLASSNDIEVRAVVGAPPLCRHEGTWRGQQSRRTRDSGTVPGSWRAISGLLQVGDGGALSTREAPFRTTLGICEGGVEREQGCSFPFPREPVMAGFASNGSGVLFHRLGPSSFAGCPR